MPEDKSDMRLVAKAPTEGSPPAGLRLMKTVRGRDESLYLLVMPGVVPNPLKLSIHPSGEIHLKAIGAEVIARVDRDQLFENLKSGVLDGPIAKFLNPKLPRVPADGFFVPPDVFDVPKVKAGEPLKDANVSMKRLFETMTKVELDKLSELPKAIQWLRAEGRLPQKGMLFLAPKGSDRPIVFVSLADAPWKHAPEKLPEGLPYPKTFQALLDGLREHGGLLLTMPDENDLRELARMVGLGDFLDGLDWLSKRLDEPSIRTNVSESMEQIVASFVGPLEAVVRGEPLRPLKQSIRPRRVSPRSGRTSRWRRPRFRVPNPRA
jgi:hypothetical protein